MTVAQWHEAGRQLSDAGLTDLAALYLENAKRVSRGEPPIWPIPPALRASATIAAKPQPAPFVADGRDE